MEARATHSVLPSSPKIPIMKEQYAARRDKQRQAKFFPDKFLRSGTKQKATKWNTRHRIEIPSPETETNPMRVENFSSTVSNTQIKIPKSEFSYSLSFNCIWYFEIITKPFSSIS